MSYLLVEGNLQFDFSACKPITPVQHFDSKQNNPYGMKTVDFFTETEDCLYFVEVKDYQHPEAKQLRRQEDYEMLTNAIMQKTSVFTLEMGQKIKDSLLRKYALGEEITKQVIYLLFVNLDGYGSRERLRLKEKIGGYIPMGLNDDKFAAFTSITFDLVNVEQLEKYGIACKPKV
ncbi:MAG: hypothetical protein FWC89_01165 [Defluviitaleaceae bacterium]|nr:hypothetical protein [Defluviitaleaceae bacterium]